MVDTWEQIPFDTEVLITHGPAYNMLDHLVLENLNVGCKVLRSRLLELPNLRVHVCGHTHSAYNSKYVPHPLTKSGSYLAINAASCNEAYKISNQPIVFKVFAFSEGAV